jgi:very-short-patch-repair endonuclease
MAKKVEEVKEYPKTFVIEVDGEPHELIARDDVQAEAFKQQGFKEK